jgi:hypothetical protein
MTTFQLSPLPETLLEWPDTITKHLQQSSTQHHKVAKEHLNYRSLYGLGCFSEKTLFLPESMDDPDNPGQKNAKQDPKKFSPDVVNGIAPKFPAAELALFEEQIKTPAFQDGATHLLMQTNLRVAIDEIAQHHSIIGYRYGTLQSEVTDPGDMYQGSRAVANMIQAMDEHLEREQSQLNADCLNIIMALRQTEQLSVASFVEAVHSVQS